MKSLTMSAKPIYWSPAGASSFLLLLFGFQLISVNNLSLLPSFLFHISNIECRNGGFLIRFVKVHI